MLPGCWPISCGNKPMRHAGPFSFQLPTWLGVERVAPAKPDRKAAQQGRKPAMLAECTAVRGGLAGKFGTARFWPRLLRETSGAGAIFLR